MKQPAKAVVAPVTYYCWRCEHRWYPRSHRVPSECPRCRTRRYDQVPKEEGGSLMNAISVELATRRARFRTELVRLRARAWEGGPEVVYREGAMLVAWPDDHSHLLEERHVSALRGLPDGCGPAWVREAVSQVNGRVVS